MVERIRRVRVTRPSGLVIPASDKARMQDLVRAIALIDRDTERMAKERAEKLNQLHRLMLVFKQNTVEIEEAVASLFTPKGRAQSRIDPYQFASLVEEADFYACVEVIKARAEKVLSGKELDRITDTTPGRPGDETVKITRR